IRDRIDDLPSEHGEDHDHQPGGHHGHHHPPGHIAALGIASSHPRICAGRPGGQHVQGHHRWAPSLRYLVSDTNVESAGKSANSTVTGKSMNTTGSTVVSPTYYGRSPDGPEDERPSASRS